MGLDYLLSSSFKVFCYISIPPTLFLGSYKHGSLKNKKVEDNSKVRRVERSLGEDKENMLGLKLFMPFIQNHSQGRGSGPRHPFRPSASHCFDGTSTVSSLQDWGFLI